MSTHKSLLHFCSYSWETGGPSSFILNHSKFQFSKGMQIEVASPMFPEQNSYELAAGMRVHEFPKGFLARILPDFSMSMATWFWKNRNAYDYIHIHGLWHFGTILPFLIPNRAKKIVTIHGFLDPFMMQKSKWIKKIFWLLFQKRCLARADILHAMNDEEYATLLQLFPYKKEQIFFIGNGIEDPLAQNFGVPNPEFVQSIEQFIGQSEQVFLFLSRISFKKGLDILLAAFQEFSQKHPGQFKLIIAGPEDDFSPQLNEYCSNHPNKDRFVLGMVQGAEKDYLFKRCNTFVLPSYSEGFSIAALEAIAYGKSCIFSSRIGFAHAVKAYQAGIVIEPDFQELINILENFTNSKNSLTSNAKNSRKLFLENFTSQEICLKFYQILNV